MDGLHGVVTALCLVGALGCGDVGSGTDPDPGGAQWNAEGGGLTLETAVGVKTLQPGQTTKVEFRLRNRNTESVTLRFRSGCQVLPYIVRDPGRKIVYPEGGGWACTLALTSLTLAAGETKTLDVTIAAGTAGAPAGAVVLEPGLYEVYAEMNSETLSLRSRPDTLTVK